MKESGFKYCSSPFGAEEINLFSWEVGDLNSFAETLKEFLKSILTLGIKEGTRNNFMNSTLPPPLKEERY